MSKDSGVIVLVDDLFKFKMSTRVFDIGGNIGVVTSRRYYDYSTGGCAVDYFVEFEHGGRWVDQGALFTERPSYSY